LHTAYNCTIADCFFDFGELGDMGDVEDTELMFPKQELIEDNSSSSSMIDTQPNAYMQAPAGFNNLQPLSAQPQQQQQQQQQWQQPYAPVAAAAAPQRLQRSQYEPMELHEERKRKASSAAPTLSTDKMAMKDLTEQQKLERRVRTLVQFV
jgi:hypothetical protein